VPFQLRNEDVVHEADRCRSGERQDGQHETGGDSGSNAPELTAAAATGRRKHHSSRRKDHRWNDGPDLDRAGQSDQHAADELPSRAGEVRSVEQDQQPGKDQ